MPDFNINIGARISSSLRGTLQEARQQYASFAQGVSDATRQLTGMSVGEIVLDHLREKFAELALGPVASFVVGIGAVNIALRLMESSSAAAAEGLERFRKVEDIQATFQPLLGGATQARARLAELSKFAADTPFELPEVAAASKTLEVLTRGALSTGEGLRLVGDVAASSGASFQEIAMWVGRLYDNLQSGRPIGEAMMRLQELGTVSGVTRAKIEDMQKAGAAGNDVWKVAKAELDRTSGSMAVLSQTITGLRSTMEDAKSAMYRAFANSMVDQEKESVKGATDAIEAMTPIAEHLGDVLADLSVPDAPNQWFTVFDVGIKNVITGAAQAKDSINVLISFVAAATTGFIAFATVSGGQHLLALANRARLAAIEINALRVASAGARLEWTLWPPTILANIREMTAKLAVNGAVTVGIRAQAVAVVLARTAWASLTGTLVAARGATLAFMGSGVGLIASALAGLYLYYRQLERTTQKLRELAEESAAYTSKAFHATDGIATTTDRLTKLAAAYADIKKAREDLAKAPEDEKELRKQNLTNAETTARRIEQMNPRDLKPGEELKAAQDVTKKTYMDTYEKGLDPAEKLVLAQARLNDLKRIQHGLDEASGKAQRAAHHDRLQELSKEINGRRTAYDAVQAADEAEEKRLRAAAYESGGQDGAADDIKARREWREKSGEGKAIRDLEDRRNSLAGAADAARLTAEKGRGDIAKGEASVESEKRAKFDYDVQQAELMARERIANLQEEGAARAYQEYVIAQDLTREKWELAKANTYLKEEELARAEYLERQVKTEREWVKERKVAEARGRDIRSGRLERWDARMTRAIDQAEGRGKITGKEADEQRAQLADRQRARALREAERLRDDARAAKDPAEADRARKAEVEKRKEADALGWRADDYRNPVPQRQSAVADSMRRVGGGGNAFYGGSGRNPLEVKADRQITLLEKIEASSRRIEGKRGGSSYQ